jgi:membrane fusion protein (multidrug efflux system)
MPVIVRSLAPLAVLLWAAAAVAQSAAPPAAGYIVVQPQPVHDEQSYTGHVQAEGIVHLQARVTGFLDSQNFTDGAQVAQGQLLYVIEPPPYQAALAQAQAALAQAQAQAHLAGLTLARAEALLHTSAGEQATVDAAATAAAADTAAVQSAQAAVQTAQINLGYTQIRAPIAGIVGATTVTPGNVVGPTSGVLATITSVDPIYVTFALPTDDALKYRATPGALDVILHLPDGSAYAQTGTVDFVNNQVDPTTDTLTWRAVFPNPAQALTDGEFVGVTLRAHDATQALVLPLAAVLADQLGNYVFVIGADGKVQRRGVTLGEQTGETAVVLSGLKPGDEVVTEGLQSLRPGAAVAPYKAAQ